MELHKYEKWVFYAALALLAVVVLWRVIPRRQREGGGETGRANLVFVHYWDNALGRNTLSELVKEFEKEHRGIRIRLQNLSYAEERELLFRDKAEFEGNTLSSAFDIVALDGAWIPELLSAGKLQALTGSDDDSGSPQWTVPLISFMNLLYYNIDILKLAGLDRPPANRMEFLSAARTLKENRKENQSVPALSISLGSGDPEALRRDIYSWIRAAGSNPEKNGFDEKRTADVFNFLSLLNREGFLLPGIFLQTGAERLEDFIAGKTAMLTANTGNLRYLRARMGDKLGLTLIPGQADFGKPGLAPSVWHAGISSDCTHPEEAREFIGFLKEKSIILSEKSGAVPGTGLRFHDPEEDPLYEKAWSIYEASDVFEGNEFPASVDAAVREELMALFESGRSGEETAKRIQSRIEAINPVRR
ncbi:MAG: extracellular solute-binding protein [Treponema sp.]|jgi:ABC-type glycerol-3-phosphate transport system substrate-binding protein|nr:extracellular solute-binding protein [Treponema sp.]